MRQESDDGAAALFSRCWGGETPQLNSSSSVPPQWQPLRWSDPEPLRTATPGPSTREYIESGGGLSIGILRFIRYLQGVDILPGVKFVQLLP
jgi:hypothetical protein